MTSCLVEDDYINSQATHHDISEIQDCAIAVDATYYLQRMLTIAPSREPLLTALGGLTGIQNHIEHDLDQWETLKITPFFVFDGQPISGQEEVFVSRGRRAIEKSNHAWGLYVSGHAQEAVESFGDHNGAYQIQKLYPMLQAILKQRNLHFLVPPHNAAAQIAYFDMIDSDQCGGIMGPQELLLYPIHDCVIRSMDWENGTVTAISKKQLIKSLQVSENTFIDGLLMTIVNALSMLRSSDKQVSQVCNTFNEVLKAQDPAWLDKYFKARMAVQHFIYIAESGEVKVHDFEHLTGDNHEYLGLQLPSELYHYLNVGLIGPRVLSWITHSKIMMLPTVDGQVSDEYRKLVTSQLVPVKETTLGLLIPRLNRGIQHREVKMRVWFDEKFSHTLNYRNMPVLPSDRAATWAITDEKLRTHFPRLESGTIAFEVLALHNPGFVKATVTKERIKVESLDSSDVIVSVAIWRMLHLRGYLTDSHELSPWGQALALAIAEVEPTVRKYPEFPGLYEALLVAFELVRYGVLHTRHTAEETHGLPLNGTDDDRGSLLLLSRVATLLKLRHNPNGYTGPLNKTLLVFQSVASTVRDADRDLIDAIVASLFMHAQAKREREDLWQISNRLPFLNGPDIAFGIAIKTLLDEVVVGEADDMRQSRIDSFPPTFLPHASHFREDLEIFYSFFEALATGIKALPDGEMRAADKAIWETATKYLELRR